MIGGIVGGTYGIVCNFTLEGSEADISIIDNVRKALDLTYDIESKVGAHIPKEFLARFRESR